MVYSLALILLIFSQLMFSCGTDNRTENTTVTSGTWMLEKIKTGKVSENIIENPGDYTLRLKNNGSFKLVSDCNKCSGKYTTASKFIKFTEVDCTKKICGKGSHDYLFRTYIEKASSFKIRGGQLKLGSYKGTMNFSLK